MSALSNNKFAPFAERMRAAKMPDLAIKTFEYYYTQLVEGQTGFIPEDEIEPVESLPDAEAFPKRLAELGRTALPKTVIIKLNGGLGTSMGLHQAKSLLPVKNGLTFLDIVARQAMTAGLPLLLMNSFVTRADSLARLERYSALWGDIPVDFLQHKVPKVDQADLTPVKWPREPELEWCPPGHGDIYTALITSGTLDILLEAGYQYAFVANVDNLGAVVEPAILGHFVDQQLPFLMEAADRTEADKKGGHLAQRPDGQLILRESAQCLPEDKESFQDISRHKYFNTNNLWLNLPTLKQVMAAQDNILGLPMIRNSKTVDPRDPDSTPVYQLETAMGSAIAVFQGAGAIRVPRTRFAPVKTNNDLLAVRSNAYLLTEEYHVIPNPERQHDQLTVNLDPDYYQLIDDMEARFPDGVPSLLQCKEFSVKGDVKFGEGVKLVGRVKLVNPAREPKSIEDGAVLEGTVEL
jgi:UTP--glucose-1-phosphate uridylyltransferase